MCTTIRRLGSPRVVVPLLIAVLAASPAAADLDVVFVLDTTGSMGGEIREVQERVRQLAVSLAEAREGERLRYGIVAYRDRGDEYVTLPFDLSDDVGAAERFLSSLRANGGGDGPESVVAAVAAGLHEMSWDRSDDVERQIFLIGDAPPHLDYHGEPTPDELVAEARRARIVINAIGCRSLPPQGVRFFRSLAYATEGSYQHIGRVEAARAGALTEALGRSVIAASDTAGGRELEVGWLAHTDADSTGILVRQSGPGGVGQSREGDGLEPCTLEVRLPVGYALRYAPVVRLGSGRLWVELNLTEGPGGRDLYSLSECPPAATPISVSLGGE
jgi:Mg-chelatase subunit ChlD